MVRRYNFLCYSGIYLFFNLGSRFQKIIILLKIDHFSGDDANIAVKVKQLEQQNERLKEALVK